MPSAFYTSKTKFCLKYQIHFVTKERNKRLASKKREYESLNTTFDKHRDIFKRKVVGVHVMRTWGGGGGVDHHSILALALDGGERSA